jgi:hypothetical protein
MEVSGELQAIAVSSTGKEPTTRGYWIGRGAAPKEEFFMPGIEPGQSRAEPVALLTGVS